jgi:hypothetical protein
MTWVNTLSFVRRFVYEDEWNIENDPQYVLDDSESLNHCVLVWLSMDITRARVEGGREKET